MRERLEQTSRSQATPDKSQQGAAARLEDSPADNRVRLFFPAKPSADIRGQLKARGFRWAPSMGCWQAYRNWRTLETAQAIAQIAGTTPTDTGDRGDYSDRLYEDNCRDASGL
jgi:hypothetical protein